MQAALLQADGGKLTTEMLSPLLRAVPEQKEVADIQLYLKVCEMWRLVVLMSCMKSGGGAASSSKALYSEAIVTGCELLSCVELVHVLALVNS